MAGMLGEHLDVQESMLGELPHRFRRVGEERGFGAQQPLVPGKGALVVADREACEEIDPHTFTLPAAVSHSRGEVFPSDARLYPFQMVEIGDEVEEAGG